jgi:hypothetical protein
MKLRIACTLAVLIAGVVAVPSLKAGTVDFTYTGQPVSSTAVTGFGSFSYNGSLTTVALGNLTSFTFELDLTSAALNPNPAIFDFTLADVLTFSATVSGNSLTALSLTTDSQAAENSDNFDDTQKELIVTSLGTNNAAIDSFIEVGDPPYATGYDIGTINAQVVPEPSTWLLTGGAALLLFVFRRRAQTTKA